MRIMFKRIISMVLVLLLCQSIITPVFAEETSDTVPVTGVELDQTTMSLTLGMDTSGTLNAAVLPENATNQSVTWTSSNESVATVSGGIVTPVGEGETEITVTTDDGGHTAVCKVTITKPAEISATGVELDQTTMSLTLGMDTSGTLNAAVLPENATNQSVTWTSSNESVATVSGGIVTPVGEGETEITVTTDDGGHTAVCKVTITKPAEISATGVELDRTTMSLTLGVDTSGVLKATVLPEGATNQSVTWTSSNETVATVVGGTVTPVGEGETNITVTTDEGSYTAVCKVTIAKPEEVSVTGVKLDKATMSLTLGEDTSGTLNAAVLPEGATNQSVTWSSSNETVATVSDGIVTPVSEGETDITVTTVEGSYTDACKVTVSAQETVKISNIQVNYNFSNPVPNYKFSEDVTTYHIVRADAPTSYAIKITASELPAGKTVFAQLYINGKADTARTTAPKLTANKAASIGLTAQKLPAMGKTTTYTIKIGLKEKNLWNGAFTKIYTEYTYVMSATQLCLSSLTAKTAEGGVLALSPAFNSSNISNSEYAAVAPATAESILLSAAPKTSGVTVCVGTSTENSFSDKEIVLENFKTDDPFVYKIPIVLTYTGGDTPVESTYTLTVTKKNPTPVITEQPANQECDKHDSISLTVAVQPPEEGELSYQWYKRKSSSEYTMISGATEASYTPDTSLAGTEQYKCVITNTVGGTPYIVESEIAAVTVRLSEITPPEIIRQPGTFTIERIDIIEKYKTVYSFGESLEPIYIALDQLEEGEVYSYNWYYNTENTTTNGTLLEEEHTGPNIRDGYYFQGFKLPHKFDAGTYYIYCEVTASSESDPNLKATTTSEAVEITFNEVSLDDFEGSGSESDPYLIQSADDLVELRELVNARQFCIGLYFKMTQDVTLPAEWKPIGRAANADEVGKNLPYKGVCAFRGIFDGGGHTLTVPEGGKPLFNYVGEATIKNLNIYGKKIDGYGLVNSYYIDYGTDNVYNYGDPYCVIIDNVRLLSGSQTLCAGFLDGSGSGINTVTIRNSVVEKDVIIGYDRQQYAIGSFVGGNFNGVIENCESYADVYGISEVGGLAGNKGQTMGLCKVQNSRFYGNVVATGNHVGGIIGRGYPEEGEVRTAPNSPWVTIVGCTVTGSITGKNYVGGIFGAETSTIQCWGNDFGGDSFSANSSGSIRNNSFTGKINASGNYVGAIAGYLESLNRYTVVADNYYSADCGVDTGIGFIHYIDTSCETHETTSGAIYFDTSKEMPALTGVSIQNANRTDDPLGADAEKLCYTEKRGEKYVDTLSISGYKKEYQIGDPFDTTGMVFTATWSDGTTTNPDPKTDIQFVGFDSSERGEKTIQATYKNATVNFTIIVKQKAGTIDVTISILGDSKHGANGSVHTYAEGGLTTWVGATTYTVDSNATVWTVLKKCLDENGYTYSNSTGNYVASINGLAEFTNGKNSGWMYTLNGSYPKLGVSQQYLNDGDVIVFHYTDDYTVEKHGFNNDTTTGTTTGGTTGGGTSMITTADRNKSAAVDKLIEKIGTVTKDSGPAIEAARKAYNDLTPTQKRLVTKLKELTDAEKAYAKLTATAEDQQKAKDVMDKISKIGNVTKDSKQDIKDARKAYDALTDLQKLLVDNYDVLTAAETKFAMLDTLGKVSEPYISTGEYMEKLGTPGVGSIGGEWMAIGLARSGRNVPGVEDYYKKVQEYVAENIDPDTGRLHKAKSTDNSRMILALTALGRDVTNVGGYNLLAGLSDLEFVKYQGNNGPIWALLALDSGNYPVPSGGTVTRQALIDEILRVQTSDGGWTVSGDKADSDMTGMALTALAPYYTKDLKVQEAIDKAIARLSEMQDEDGGYSTSYDGTTKIATSESISQVVTALSALGINADTDPRFVKNGNSVIDALLRYYVKGGGFKHIMDGELDGMATEQAYYALTAYYRFLSGKTNLYDMTDIIDMGGDVVTVEPTVPAATEPAQANTPWWIIAVCIFGGVGWGVVIGIVLVPKLNKKKD